ncbi:hypothetical protein [Synechocystis sp. LEGE 06083]|uniref:hypothetical protein n=1 Tax=Synechocystis sp. LEGE 06083 TaxID=915336 RepID=UPI001D144192|nr:hypothetical protein [Synechocystis sp. LEGE 06083]
MVNFWCDNFPSGWVGRYLFKYFRQAGLTDITLEPITICLTEFELADKNLDLSRTVEKISEQRFISQNNLILWLMTINQCNQAGDFFCAFTAFLVSGKKP